MARKYPKEIQQPQRPRSNNKCVPQLFSINFFLYFHTQSAILYNKGTCKIYYDIVMIFVSLRYTICETFLLQLYKLVYTSIRLQA